MARKTNIAIGMCEERLGKSGRGEQEHRTGELETVDR